MRGHFDRDLKNIQQEILAMAGMIEDAMNKAIRSLMERDINLAEEVLEGDDAIDMKELDVEEKVIKALALHQPVANDLRYLVAILKVNNDMERIGDLSQHVASRAKHLAKHAPIRMPERLQEMVDLVRTMVRQSIQALITQDAALAKKVVLTDVTVDEIHWEAYRELLERMRQGTDDIDLAFHTISVFRHLERIADHAANICEDVYFMVKAEVIKHQLDDDSTAGMPLSRLPICRMQMAHRGEFIYGI